MPNRPRFRPPSWSRAAPRPTCLCPPRPARARRSPSVWPLRRRCWANRNSSASPARPSRSSSRPPGNWLFRSSASSTGSITAPGPASSPASAAWTRAPSAGRWPMAPTSSWARRAGFATTWSGARSTPRRCASSFWMKPTRCLIWASARISNSSSTLCRRSAARSSSPPPSRARSRRWPNASSATLSASTRSARRAPMPTSRIWRSVSLPAMSSTPSSTCCASTTRRRPSSSAPRARR